MGSTRFTSNTGGGIGKVHRWWVSFLVICGVWYGFPADLKAHAFLSFSLSHLTLSILGLNLKWIWSRSWVCFICFGFLTNLKKSFAVYVEKGYFGFAVCVEKGYSGFVKGSFLGLRMKICWVCEKGIFLDYQFGEKNVQILRLMLPRKCLI